MTDLLLANGRVVDGTGAPWFRGSVAVADGRIERVVRGDPDVDAAETVDLDGAVVCPGFVDTHSHSDLRLFEESTLAPKIRQGITTEILGQDGFSMAPVRPADADGWRRHLAGLAGDVEFEWSWDDTAEYLDAVEDAGVGPNVATLVGHGTVRYRVMGMDDRPAEESELAAMADLVDEALGQGAVGFSTGLVYSPQTNATTEEVLTLAEELAPYGRPFVAHIRNEGRHIWEALDEFVDVGDDAGVPLHLSHYKVTGRTQQGNADRANHVIEAARARGVDITAEQYPYTAGNTLLSAVLPPWVHAGTPEETLARLRDPESRERIRRDVEEWRVEGWTNMGPHTGWENIVVRNLSTEEWAPYEGESVADIAADRGKNTVLTVCDLLADEELTPAMILHSMSESDVREIMANERVCVATDGLFGAYPHPRTYGTYPRVLGHYVREENHLTLETAIRKMTSLPARIVGLDDRGVVRPGAVADLAVVDPVSVIDRATFDQPRQHPRGVEHVLVGGEFAVRDGETTGATPGEVIRA
jgi:N-acyl-D-amino-acid deacylase